MSNKAQLTQEQKDEFKQAFELFDTNNNGRISRKELKKIMEGLGQYPTQVEIDELIKEVDADGDGLIDYAEFETMLSRKMSSNEEEDNLKQAFQVFDKAGRGKIGASELREVMLGLGEDLTDAQIKIMIDEISSKKDGYVTFDDFKNAMLGD